MNDNMFPILYQNTDNVFFNAILKITSERQMKLLNMKPKWNQHYMEKEDQCP